MGSGRGEGYLTFAASSHSMWMVLPGLGSSEKEVIQSILFEVWKDLNYGQKWS